MMPMRRTLMMMMMMMMMMTTTTMIATREGDPSLAFVTSDALLTLGGNYSVRN